MTTIPDFPENIRLLREEVYAEMSCMPQEREHKMAVIDRFYLAARAEGYQLGLEIGADIGKSAERGQMEHPG